MRRLEYFGDHLFREIAMDEAPARASEPEDDAPRFGALNAALDAAQAAIDAARKEVQSGADSDDGAFSFDSVRASIGKARDCMDQLEEHLSGGPGGADSASMDPADEDREAAHRRARDGQVDHRRDFAPGKRGTTADSRRGMAQDRRRAATLPDLDEVFPQTARRGSAGARVSVTSLDEIFAPIAS